MAELNRSVTLLACQIDVPAMTTAAERDVHTDRVAAAIDAELTAGGPVDLVVLLELGTLDYARSCFDRIDEMAELLDNSPTIDRVRKVAAAQACIPARARFWPRWKCRWRFSGCWRHARTFSGPRRRNGSRARKAARFAGWTSRSGK